MEIQSNFSLELPEFPQDVSFAEYLFKEFQKYGNKTALISSDTKEEWKFSDLQAWVTTAAERLQDFAVKKESRVAFAALNSPEILLLQFACSYLGLNCIALNARGTLDEIVHQVQVSEPTHIFTEQEFLEKIRAIQMKISSVEKVALVKQVVQKPHENSTDKRVAFKGDMNKDHILYFSSGTTGLPKAVQTSHKSMAINFLQMNSPHLQVDTGNKGDRFLAQLPFHHLYGTNIAYWCLYSGTTVVTMAKFLPLHYLRALQDYNITILHTVPPLVQLLTTHPDVHNYDLTHLHSVVSCGAPLDPQIAKKCVDQLKLRDFRQLYGMTEILTTCWSSAGDKHYASAGRPVPGVKIKILDPATRKTVKPGVEGEICVFGPAITSTYYNNPEATRNLYDTEGYVKTGDFGRYDTEGYIYIAGRIKEIIKYKGTQISPAEVEKAVRSHEGIADVAVVGKPDNETGELPTGFIVKKSQHSHLTQQDIHDHLKGLVSSYKELKGGVYFVESIPRTPSGKTLRRSLITMMETPIC